MRVAGHEWLSLEEGWRAAHCDPGACAAPEHSAGLRWSELRVPGTAAAVLAGAPWELDGALLDGQDWWFRRTLELPRIGAGETLVLVIEGIATIADIHIDGVLVHRSESMFEPCALALEAFAGRSVELSICARALTPVLARSRRPRARWRTRLVADGALRFHRTMLIGRAPGFAPGPAVVGPWRPLRIEHRRVLEVARLTLRPRVEGDDGVLAVAVTVRALGGGALEGVRAQVEGPGGDRFEAELEHAAGGEAAGELRIPGVSLWWPHTHGEPVRYAVSLLGAIGGETVAIDCGRVGFRTLQGGEALEREGLALAVNGVPVFARGALWTPFEAGGSAPSVAALRGALERLRDGGMNMVRVPGTGAYESAVFHDLCDELGILLWQDFMFANLDYPQSDPGFIELVRREVACVLEELGGRPSLAVLCGSSEIDQQVAMLGLDPQLVDGPLFGELLPALVEAAGLDAVYVPSAPWGGALPFRPDRGVANYYGVGGYRRGLDDARRAQVRFAAECLGFANVPDERALEELAPGATIVVGDARWKAGVPRDAGSSWDFDDVRDHYLQTLMGVDAPALRRSDPQRYLELSRAISGEVMAEVFGEWRRRGSPCAGGLVLWWRDLRPGAGWGLLDHRGAPKAAYHHLRRALAPLAVWSTDEGLRGIDVHVANDGPHALDARLRITCYRDQELAVEEVIHPLALAPHSAATHNVEDLLGRFVDVSWAYRFGPPAADVIAFSLERERDGAVELLSQAFRLPAGRPLAQQSAEQLGLRATLRTDRRGRAVLSVATARFAYGVRIEAPGVRPDDDWFCLEPGGERTIELTATEEAPAGVRGTLSALNMHGRVAIVTHDRA